MKKYLILFLVFFTAGCAQVMTKSSVTQYNPQKHARIRVILEVTYGRSDPFSLANFKIQENGEYKEYGFFPVAVGFYLTGNESSSLGMLNKPRYVEKNTDVYYREFIVPAESEIILPNTTSKSCSEAWLFPTCYEYKHSNKFIAHAGKDYEIANSYHVYEILSEKEYKEIPIDSKTISSRKL